MKVFFAQEEVCDEQLKISYLKIGEKDNVEVQFVNFSDDCNLLHDYLVSFLGSDENLPVSRYKRVKVHLLFFFSPKDLIVCFGFNNIEKFFKEDIPRSINASWIVQNRNIFGNFRFKGHKNEVKISYKCRDLFGFTNSSLKDLASSFGVEMSNKTILDDYKENMLIPFQNHPEEFFKYGMDDTLKLMEIFDKIISQINRLLVETLKIPYFLRFSKDKFACSTGRLVSEIFEKYLIFWALGSPSSRDVYYSKKLELDIAFAKLSVLKTSSPNYSENIHLWNKLFESNQLPEILKVVNECNLTKHPVILGYAYGMRPYSYGGINWFLLQDGICFTKFNAIVSGGRCNNEIPYKYKYTNCADVDMSSCYGSALKAFSYPVGISSIYSSTPNETPLTLREFLEKYEEELLPNLYKITVSGKLTFEQDLIYSKLITPNKLTALSVRVSKQFHENEDDNAHVDADLVLLRKEIINGVITSDVLEVIRKVSTNLELKEFMNLQVVTASYWAKSDLVETPEGFIHEVIESCGKMEYNTDFNAVLDGRSKKWFQFPLKELLEPLIAKRKAVKAKLKLEKDPEKRKVLNAEQNALKLIINTIYGILASLYFSVGNAVIADNITARARVDCWKMSKCLGISQCITDGGFYELMKVRYLKIHDNTKDKRLPGFHVLSDPERIKSHRNIKTTPLQGLDWTKEFELYPNSSELLNLDRYVKDHILKFWSNYDLPFNFDIEHKMDNLALKAATYSKAHYLFLTWDEKTKDWSGKFLCVRGVEKGAKVGDNPYYNLLNNIICDSDLIPEKLDYSQKYVIKIRGYKIKQKSKSTSEEVKQLRPGDSFIVNKRFRAINSWIFTNTEDEYKKRKRRSNYDMGFERYAKGRISILYKKMLEDNFGV